MSDVDEPTVEKSAEQSAPEDPLLQSLRDKFGEAVLATHSFRGDRTAVLDRGSLVDACSFLRDDPVNAFDMLVDVTAVDYLGRKPRFEVVYHLLSIQKNHRLRLKVPLEEDDAKVASVVPVWSGANWLEREAWDLYGIQFDGHPDLKRIYLYEEFEGHPLRKDYPKEKRQPLIGPGAPVGANADSGESRS
ncbi:MAG: NADH-quinone oxidoreductase subunit C [Candidatus Binatia bacterium]|nr:NADH-quinone oxidoreductase subunit C [Candidatus Binatia bacterium]